MSAHLNSEQLETVLAGRASEAAAGHMSTCARCAEEAAALRGAMGNFRSATIKAGEHHRHFAQVRPVSRMPRIAWTVASVVMFAGLAAPLAVRRAPVAPAGGTVAVKPAEPISDEALLNSVQNDLTASVPESLLPLAGTPITL